MPRTDDFILELLRARGIETKGDIEKFLRPSYDEHLHDPLLMKNMPQAAERLASAIASGEKIAVWTDYDCDGAPGAVLMHDFLTKAGANFEIYIPHRHLEGYGVNSDGVQKLADRGATLLVTVDSGITDVAPIAKARSLALDVIVTDHHLPSRELPNAIVVDDKQEGETYPFPELCGCATAWKLCCATLAVSPLVREKIPSGWEKWLLDMVGLATIADMMPLVGENRVLAHYGLRVLRKSPRVGLQKLCRLLRIDQSRLTEDDVGFMIAPRINAASRMGDAYDVLKLFTTTDEAEAERLARKLDESNRQRKAQAGAITRAVHANLKAREKIPSVIALGDPSWRPALLGLVANGIAEEYARPVFLWGREGNEILKGSCRSDGSVHVLELMSAATETFLEFGGHAESGGFTVRDEAVFYLEERLVAAHETVPKSIVAAAQRTDATLSLEAVTFDLLRALEQLAPFGEANPKPAFLIKNCEVASVVSFGKGNEHLKLKLKKDSGEAVEGVSFFAKGEIAKAARELAPSSRADLTANLERDSFSGRPRLRLLAIVPA